MAIVREGGWVSVMWELIVVIAAGLAVVTNMLVIGSFSSYNKQLKQMQQEVYFAMDEVERYERYVDELSEAYAELQAQVQWGLAEKYVITEE